MSPCRTSKTVVTPSDSNAPRRPAGRGRLRPQPARTPVRLLRHAECPLRQGEKGAAAAAERPVGNGLAVEAVADYVEDIRPRFGFPGHPALWVTERGGRVKPAEINARFTAYRDALGLPKALTVHSERHSYVTHLTVDGADRRFIQQQVGHEC